MDSVWTDEQHGRTDPAHHQGNAPAGDYTESRIADDHPRPHPKLHLIDGRYRIGNDLGFTEVTIAAMVGHSKGPVTSKYIYTLDTALIMAAETIAGYIAGLLDGRQFQQTSYAFDRDSRKAALARFLNKVAGEVVGENHGEEPFAA